MKCTYCGTELPEGALFCGECGRAAAAAKRVPVPVEGRAALVEPETAEASAIEEQSDGANTWHWGEPDDDPASAAVAVAEHASASLRCDQCGAELAAEDIFCGECGAVSQVAARHFSQPRDTVVIDRLSPVDEDSLGVIDPLDRAPGEPEPQALVIGQDPVDVAESVPLVAEPVDAEPVVAEPVDAEPEAPAAPAVSSHSFPFADVDDVEATRIIKRVKPGERFVLQFSTGESFTVFGSGLVGRNPLPEPGEYFDQLVRVIDPSRSVSKTHLEFGQADGGFWILDRYSGNGTIVRQPETAAVRCLPDKRYRLVRGSRVDIGEQFFVVS